MKPTWSEALTALEENLPLIIAVQEEYDQYIEAIVKELANRVRTVSEGRFAMEPSEDDEYGDWALNWEPGNDLADAGIDVRVWASAAYGGPSGWLRVGVYLGNNLSHGLPELPTVLTTARDALSGWKQDPIDTAPSDVCDDDDDTCLGYLSTAVDAPDLVDQFVYAVFEACKAAETAAEAILRLRVFWRRAEE